jgi:hypothetical protein
LRPRCFEIRDWFLQLRVAIVFIIENRATLGLKLSQAKGMVSKYPPAENS